MGSSSDGSLARRRRSNRSPPVVEHVASIRGPGDAVGLARVDADADADHPGVTYRRAGDRFVLVEYGPMMLDLELRARVHALEQWVAANLDGVVDATAGVRSLLVQVDGHTRSVDGVATALRGPRKNWERYARWSSPRE